MNTQTNEIKMLHEVIADYKLQNEKLTTENKELKEEKRKSNNQINELTNKYETTEFCNKLIEDGFREMTEKLKEENKELKAYKQFVKSKCENAIKPTPEKDTPTPEEEMTMVEKLSEELGQKELTIMKGELEISKVYGILREKIQEIKSLSSCIEDFINTATNDNYMNVRMYTVRGSGIYIQNIVDYKKHLENIVDSLNEKDHFKGDDTIILTYDMQLEYFRITRRGNDDSDDDSDSDSDDED